MTQVDDVIARQRATVERAIEQARPEIEGRVVVITGGARGLGGAVADAFLRAGASVVAADKSWEGADQRRSALETSGRGMAVQVDVTDDEQMDAAYEAVMRRFGTADVLVNNAALVSETLFAPTGRVKMLDTKDSDWELMFRVNTFGVLKMIRRFIRPMIEKRRGSIVNVISRGALHVAGGGGYFGLRPYTREMPYQATKAAVMAMTFYLADEVREEGVAVNAIMPGHTRASWFDTTALAWQERGQVYGARPAVPEHIVPIMLFLGAQDASGVTGMLYPVPEWNYDHGYGKHAAWLDYTLPPEMEESFRKAEANAPAGPAIGLSSPAWRR